MWLFRRILIIIVMLYLLVHRSGTFAASMLEPQTPSLAKMVIYGLSLNPRVRAVEAEVELAEKNIDVSKGGYWPSLDLSAGPADGLSGAFAYSANARYTLYDWGALDSEVQGMTAQARQKIHYLRQVRAEVGLEIVEAYLDSQMEEQRQTLIQEHQNHLARVEKIANVRTSGGYSDSSELNRVRQAWYYSEQQWQQAEGGQQQALLRLQMLIQRPVNDLPALPQLRLNLPQALAGEADQTKLIKLSPQYMQALEKINIAERDADKASAEQRPKLVLEAYSQRRKIGGKLVEDSAIAVNVRASFNQGPASFELDDVERLRAAAAKWDLQFAQMDIERNLGMQRETIAMLTKQKGAIEKQLDAATGLVAAYQDQFRAGLTTVQEMLNAERERFELANQHLNVSIELLRIPYRMSSELGILDSFLAQESSES